MITTSHDSLGTHHSFALGFCSWENLWLTNKMVIHGPNHFHPSGTTLVGNLSFLLSRERCFIRSLSLSDDFSCPSLPLYFHGDYSPIRTSLVAQMARKLPPMWETRVWFLGQEDPLEKRMATHSSILGLFWWLRQQRICLQCKRPKFDPWARKIPWRRKWQPTPVFLAGEFHGQRSLAGYSSWGHKESEITELLTLPISPFFPLTSQCLLPREFTSKLYFKKLGIWFEIIKVEKFNTWTNSITRLWVRENEVKEKWEKEVNFLSYKEILVIKKSTE